MFQGVYLIWMILPFMLVCLTCWAVLKPVFGTPGREYAMDYFKQAVFCIILLVLSIWIDQHFVVTVIDENDATSMNIVLHWMLYPLVLLIAAYANKLMGASAAHKELTYGMARYRR